jgi:uncharacterized membrane protein YkoI
MKRTNLAAILGFALCSILGGVSATAGVPLAAVIQLAAADNGRDIGPDAAASAARNATGGQVLGVQSGGRGGKPVYRVKILEKDGRVRVLRVDGQTGRVSQ